MKLKTMQSSFEVLEWESTSKEQDSLVQRLFGEISDFSPIKTTPSVFSRSGGFSVQSIKLTPSREKRKASNDEQISRKLKKKRKDKREKNKFKTGQKVTSQHTELTQDSQSEIRIDKDCDVFVSTVKETNGDVSADNVKQINQFKKANRGVLLNSKSTTTTTTEKQKDKRKDNRPKSIFKREDSLSSELTKSFEEFSTHSVNHMEQDAGKGSSKTASAEFDVRKLSEESAELKMKKAKRKKAKERRKEVAGQKKTANQEGNDYSFEQTKNESATKVISRPPDFQNKSSLCEKVTKQLESSRFRWINEQLYTTTGDEAVTMFSEDPSLFDIYHRGFTNQVKLWPVNPVDKIIEWLRKRPSSDVVADFGCGEAVIAQSVSNKVHSFDLVAKNKFVTACNMAKVPLDASSVDVAVFCLSLMGTNLEDFLREAHRVLKLGGVLKVAEVTSRISDTADFAKSLTRLGFKLQMKDISNKMFVLFDFIKDEESVKAVSLHKLDGLKLKPCIYKKR